MTQLDGDSATSSRLNALTVLVLAQWPLVLPMQLLTARLGNALPLRLCSFVASWAEPLRHSFTKR